MEQWKREVGRELNSLRGHITRATSLGNLEERCIRGGAGGRRLQADLMIGPAECLHLTHNLKRDEFLKELCECYLLCPSPQFQLKAPPRGAGTPAERVGPTENTVE